MPRRATDVGPILTLTLRLPLATMLALDPLTRGAVRDSELESPEVHAAALALRRAVRNALEGVTDAVSET